MNTADLKMLDRVRVNVRGRIFTGQYLGRALDDARYVIVLPDDLRITHRRVKPTQIKEKLKHGTSHP